MEAVKSKYQVGDYVAVSKIFVIDGGGKMIDCPEFVAEVVRVQLTASMGPSYSLEANGERLRICYWEEDIDKKVSKDYCSTCECDPCDCHWGTY